VNLSRGVDVFVVGGGPAGLAAAIAASTRGLKVAVADGGEPPLDKTCGEGLMPETVAALQLLGVKLSPLEGYPFHGIRFFQRDASVAAHFRKGVGLGLRRTALHERLVAKAEQAGVALLWKSAVSGVTQSGVHAGGRTIRSRFIIGADGPGSRVRKWSGLAEGSRLQQRFATRHHFRVKPWSDCVEIYWGPEGQAYVTPTASEEVGVVVMAGAEPRPKRPGFSETLAQWPDLRERLASAAPTSRERGAPSSMRWLPRVQSGSVALIGDASGSVDAITGEGLRLAFLQSLALADALEAGKLSLYERRHRALLRRPWMMARLMLWLAKHHAVRSRMLRRLAAQPALFAPLLAFHAGESTPAEFLSTGVALGWSLLAA